MDCVTHALCDMTVSSQPIRAEIGKAGLNLLQLDFKAWYELELKRHRVSTAIGTTSSSSSYDTACGMTYGATCGAACGAAARTAC